MTKTPCPTGRKHSHCGVCHPGLGRKIGATQRGKPHRFTPESRERISRVWRGKHLSPEHRRNISLGLHGLKERPAPPTPLPSPPTDRFGQPSPVGVVSHVFPRAQGRDSAHGYYASGECWVTVEGSGEEVLARTARGVNAKRGDRVQLAGRDLDRIVAVTPRSAK